MEARARLPKRREFKRRSRFINKTLKIFKCFFKVSNCRSSRAALLVARGLLYSQLQKLYTLQTARPNNLETMAPQRTTFSTKEFYATEVSFCRVICPGQPFHPRTNLNCEFTATGFNMPWPDKFQICHFSQ